MSKKKITEKKILLPIVVVVALVSVSLVMLAPLATAQSVNNSTNSSTANQQTVPKITGSINVNNAIQSFLKNNIKVSFSDASATAAGQVTNGQVVAGRLGVVEGYLVYTFLVADLTNQTGHMVIVDPGNGQVLYTSPAYHTGPFGGMMMANHFGGWKAHHFNGGGMMWHKNSNQQKGTNNGNGSSGTGTSTQSAFTGQMT